VKFNQLEMWPGMFLRFVLWDEVWRAPVRVNVYQSTTPGVYYLDTEAVVLYQPKKENKCCSC
jgi:hypothetical protein